MRAGVSEAVLFLCLAAVGAARGMDPVPLGSGELVSGRTVLLSASADTLGTYGDPPAGPLVRTRSVAFDRRAPGAAYDEFRMMGMVFSEFTILGRSGDSLFVTAAPKKSRGRASFYPLLLPMDGLARIYDAKDAPENVRMHATLDRDYSEIRPRMQYLLAGAGLGLLLGTGLGLQFSQARNESFDAVFRQTSLYGGLGALMGIVLVVQITDF